jgi:hypothetical protein
VEIDEDSYLSSVSTDSESDASSQDDEVELDDTRQDIRTRVLRLFHGQVTEDSISVEWIREDNSYFVLVQMTAVAAAILCHLVELGDPVVHELDIAAVMYGSKCVGMDYATMRPRISTEPIRTLLAQALIPVQEIRAQSPSRQDGPGVSRGGLIKQMAAGLTRVADVTSEDGALRSPLSGMFPRDLPLPESLSAALLPVRDQVDPHRVPPATPPAWPIASTERCPTGTSFNPKHL